MTTEKTDQEKYSDLLQSHYSLCSKIEVLKDLLVEADSHLSCIVHRFGLRLPDDFVKDMAKTVDKIRTATSREQVSPVRLERFPERAGKLCVCGHDWNAHHFHDEERKIWFGSSGCRECRCGGYFHRMERTFPDGAVVSERDTIYGLLPFCTCAEYQKPQPQTPHCCKHIDEINREGAS
jgi:hypothetical protein